MKKILVSLFVFMLPMLLLAQPMDTTTIFNENFDGSSIKFQTTTNPNLGGAQGDWRLVGTGITYDNWNYVNVAKSEPKSYHSPIYSLAGFCDATSIDTIPLFVNGHQVNYVYLDFDHIAKVHQLDYAAIYYQVVDSVGADGSYYWSGWKLLNFSSNSPFYYGEAKSNSDLAITGGQFSHATYSTWNSGNIAAVPTNSWWKHELIDITSFLFADGATPQYFQIKYRTRKTSPSGTGTENASGWYVDNVRVILSNCELIRPQITMQSPFYYNTNGFVNKTGPFDIKAYISDNDTINVNSVQFSYEVNSGNTVIVPNTGALTNEVLNASGHSFNAKWQLPNVCYGDTIYYHIYLEDTHGSNARFDTFLVAHHNQTNIHYNDAKLDSLNSFPHCLITGQAQDVNVYFVNRSDPAHSPGNGGMTSGVFTLEVRNEAGVLTHSSDHTWSGDICFDVPSSQSLGSFIPTHGYNYVTVYVKSRNGQVDGDHQFDTLKATLFSCDSLLSGQYTVGGTNPDFETIEDVKRSLEFCGLGGPVVFNLRPGTYQDFDFLENYIGQSETNTITFKGENRDNVIVVNNNTDAGTNTFGAVTLVNVKNFIFRDLTIQGKNSATASRGVLVRGNGSTNILFDGCKITAHNTHSDDEASSAVSRTVAATAPSGTVSYGDTIVFRNCTLEGGNFGFCYVGSSARRNYITIDSCQITSCYRGISLNYTNGKISKNHVKQVTSNNPQNFSGIYVNNVVGADIDGNTVDSVIKLEYAIYLSNATAEDFYVRNNHVNVGNGTTGLYLNSSSSTNALTGYVYNNEIILYPVNANNGYAAHINNCNNLQVINNSILVKSDAPFDNSAALYISNGNNNTNIYNNILLNQVVCSNNTNYPIYLNGGATATGSFNDFNSISGVIAYKTVARNSINELEAAITTLTDNISLLPAFASTSSLLPTSFTGMECWRNQSVMNDIRGIGRSAVTYMGAYADQIVATDAALTAMVSPALGECPELAYDITIEITNKGAQTLNFSSNNAVITIQSTALNLNQQINVTNGSIQALDKMNKVLAQNVTIPINQVVDFKFIITTNGDNNHTNDTLVQYFTLETIVPDYSEDFSNGTQQTWTIEQVAGAGNWSFQNNAGINPTIMPVYGTGRLFFNSKNFAANTKSRAILPVVTLTGSTNPIFEMWFAHDNTSNKPKEGVVVKVSTDGGLTYTALTAIGQGDTLIKRYQNTATTPTWQLYTYNLSNYIANGCIYVAIEANGAAGNNINIDRIRVRNLHNNDISVTKIYGHGETPMHYSMRDMISATIRNEGAQAQSNIPVYLNVVGATEQWADTLYVPSLAYNTETIVTFPDHEYNVAEIKDVEVRVADDQNNINNAQHWRMVTTQNIANVADTTTDIVMIGDYNSIIRPCVRYKTNEELSVTDVKYYYDQTYIADPENGFRAFVADADGQILSTSEIIQFNTLQQGAWNIIPIKNFALTNTTGEFYVGLEMLAHGNYLCAQVETPLRDSTFYYLVDGSYVPQLSGRFMIGAVVDTPYINDLAILELLNPVTNCDLGHENLQIKITNNGTDDIVPPVQFHYTINGAAMVSETFADTLHSHETTTFTFNAVEDFTNHLINYDSNYVIKIWATKLAKDRLQFNDTLGLTVVSRGKSDLPVVADTLIVNYHTTGTLSAQLPASIPTGVIGWYTSTGYESWNFLGYSDTYTTPVIYFDTIYYATANPGTVDLKVVGTGNTSESKPFVFDKGYSRGRMLYLEQEIGAHGTISTFALNVKTAANANGSNGIPMRIYMKKTNENLFSSTSVNWNDEMEGATLVYEGPIFFNHTGWFDINLSTPFNYDEGNLMVFTETYCADYCTGTGNQCNNCGNYVSGSTGYPNFNSSSTSSTMVQYKSGNTVAQLSGSYTNNSKRLNARFTVVNLECGSEKTPIQIHVPDIPSYDVETQELLYPQTSCAIYSEHIQVQVKNMLNIPIPANKVVVHAIFNGSEITHTVAEEFAPEEVKVVEFSTPFDFSAPTANIQFDYTIFTTLNGESVVYTGNDTISGDFTSTKTAYLPDSLVYTGSYTNPYTILEAADRPSNITQYYFYENIDDVDPIHTSTTNAPYYTTPVLYDTAIYYVSGKTQGSNCVTKPIKVIINVFRPQYDLKTDEFIYPHSYQCDVLSPHLKVQVTNTDTTSNSSIPAGTFEMKADFTGAATLSGLNVISHPIMSLQQDTITFDNGINLGSQTQNRIYQYLIYTRPTDANLPVYTLNDTISGTLHIPALPVAPQNLTYTVPYGGTQTVTPNATTLNHFFFYENQNDESAFADGLSFTTDPIFAPTTYYYSGRIESAGFNDSLIVGTGGSNKTAPLDLTKGHSYAKILYNREDMGGVEGRIDSVFFYVGKAENNGIGIPMKFWMKNDIDKAAIASSNTPLVWPNEIANATLVYEGDMVWNSTGWVGFAITGGFQYTGQGLYLFVEHDCGGQSCVAEYGIDPVPQFKNSSTGTNKKVLTKANNNPATTSTSFSLSADRWNTKFKMNYTCESPKATITINTTVPQHDVGVVEIIAPVAQSNSFTANEQVQVKIKNFGTQSASNIPVSYQFNDNTPVTQNYTSSLAAGAEATMTFNTTCDLTSVYLPIPFMAYTGLTSDTYHNNDTVKMTLSSEDPCLSRPLSSATGAHITNVSFAALNNGVGDPYLNHDAAPGNGMYSDYTTTIAPTELILGQEYTLSVTHAFTNATAKTVNKYAYIDYNRNGEYETSERVMMETSIPTGDSNAVTVQVVNIPTNAQLGYTKMRVICATKTVSDPCDVWSGDGETEDYAILLSAPMQVDLGVSKVVHPEGDICADNSAKIRVMVRNYGTETQTITAENPLTVNAAVTGATNGNYTATITDGTLAPNEEMIVSVPNVNFSAQGTYNVAIQLVYGGDQYLTNNTRNGSGKVPNLIVEQLPFKESFDTYYAGEEDIVIPSNLWKVDGSNTNYTWKLQNSASPNNASGGGPSHDNTQALIPSTQMFGVYAMVPGSNGSGNQNKFTTLTSRCINMHHVNGYPVEIYFHKYFLGPNGTEFTMDVQTGSGEYYQTVETLTKEDGGQTSVNDPWTQHVIVLTDIDEVACLRFRVTGQKNKIDPSIDDINVEAGLPDMAVNRIVYPLSKEETDDCLDVNSQIKPQVEFYNNGYSAVEEFDVVMRVGTGNAISEATEHIVHHLEPGESFIYETQNSFTVTNVTKNWEVKATVVIEDDKNHYNDMKRVLACTTVSLPEYVEEGNVYLGQNQPNPAVATTKVEYIVPEPDKVTFEIVNPLGQVIFTTTQDADTDINSIEFNVSSWAAGIYYYTLHYKDITLTKKMIVEK